MLESPGTKFVCVCVCSILPLLSQRGLLCSPAWLFSSHIRYNESLHDS